MANKQSNTSRQDSKQSISQDGKLPHPPTPTTRYTQISLSMLLIVCLTLSGLSIMHLDDKIRSNIWKLETGLNLPLLLPMLRQDSEEF